MNSLGCLHSKIQVICMLGNAGDLLKAISLPGLGSNSDFLLGSFIDALKAGGCFSMSKRVAFLLNVFVWTGVSFDLGFGASLV